MLIITWGQSVHEITIVMINGVTVVNFARSKKSANSTTFPYCSMYTVNCILSDGKTHNQIDHTLIDRRQH